MMSIPRRFPLIILLLIILLYYPIHAQTWCESQKVVSSDRATEDFFGRSVSISSNYAIVGAWGEDEDAIGGDSLSSAGSAYIFEREPGGSWNQLAKLTADDAAAYDKFGVSVSISGD